MLTKRHIIDDELDALKKFTRLQDRGALVTHDQIELQTAVKRGIVPWGKLIAAWKNWAIDELRMSITAVPGVGYRLDTIHQQLERSVRLEKQGVRRTLQAGLVAAVLPDGSLDEALEAVRTSVVSRSAATRKEFNEVIATRKSLLSRQESLPRIELSGVR